MTLRKNARALPPAIFWMSVSEYPRILLVNPKVPKIGPRICRFEGPRTWKIQSTKSGRIAWKEVDQQYPLVICTRDQRDHPAGTPRTETHYKNERRVDGSPGSCWTACGQDGLITIIGATLTVTALTYSEYR